VRTFEELLTAAMSEAGAPSRSRTPVAGDRERDVVAKVAEAAARAELVASKSRSPAWAEVLGVSLPCSEHSLKQAWRRRAFETHPDRPGGSHEEFLSTRAAYERGLAAVHAGRGIARLAPAVGSVSPYASQRAAVARRSAQVAVV
jgi:hypothetical protein